MIILSILSGIFVLLGFFFFGIGLSVVIKKKPVVISSNILRSMVLVCITPIFLRPMLNVHALTLLPAIMWGLIVVMIWKQSTGYSIFGIANPAFRDSILATLNNLKIPFQEDMTGITILPESFLLETVSMSNGLSRLKVKDKAHVDWLKMFTHALRQQYKTTPTKITIGFSVFYLLFGIIMMTFAVVVFFTH